MNNQDLAFGLSLSRAAEAAQVLASAQGGMVFFIILVVSVALFTSVRCTAADLQTHLNQLYSNLAESCSPDHVVLSLEDIESTNYKRHIDRVKGDSREGAFVPSEASTAGGFGPSYLLLVNRPELFFCSGLIVRGTRQQLPEDQNAWDPYPQGRKADTSFSYLRADIKMNRLAWSYSNGFIIAPSLALNVNCFYPLDAESDKRAENGCGAFADGQSSDPQCGDDETMTDATPVRARCRYDLRGQAAVDQFAKGVAAAARASRQSDTPNDLKIETWKPGCDPRLKIRAFFYINDEGRPFAERDRKKYEEVCKAHVSLVYMKFPEDKDGRITFTVLQ